MKLEIALVTLAALAAVVFGFLMLGNGHSWGDDFAAYMMQAEALVEGTVDEFLRRNSFTVANSSWPFGPNAYPWGYPLLLSPLYWALGHHFYAYKFLNLACYAAFVVALWWLLRDVLERFDRLLLVGLFACCPVMLVYNDYVMADLPFLVLSTLALIAIGRWGSRAKEATAGQVAIGLVVFLAYAMRTNGVLLYPSLAVLQWPLLLEARNEPRLLLRLAVPYLTFLVAFAAWSIAFPDGGLSQVSVIAGLPRFTFAENASYYFHGIGEFFTGVPVAFFYATVPFFLLGLVWGTRNAPHLTIYLVVTLGFYVATPFRGGIRYLFPILPIYIVLAVMGMRSLSLGTVDLEPWRSRAARAFWLVILGFFVATSIQYSQQNVAASRARTGPFDAHTDQLVEFIRKSTPIDSTIIFVKPRILRMLTDRNAIMIDDPTELHRGDFYFFHKAWGDFDQVSPASFTPAQRTQLVRIFENHRFIGFQIRKPGPGAGG